MGEHLAREVDPGLARHVDVAEHERDVRLLEHAPRRRGRLGREALVAVGAEQAGEEGADLLLVVDDQDPLVGLRRAHLRVIGS